MNKPVLLLTLLSGHIAAIGAPLDSWTLRNSPHVPFRSYTGLTFGNGKFLAASASSSDGLILSTNGRDWTLRNDLTYGGVDFVSFANGRYYIGVNYGAVVYS